MKKNNSFLFFFIAVVVLLGVFMIFGESGEEEINWKENYRDDSKDPFGNFVLVELLKKKHNGQLKIGEKPVHEGLDMQARGSNYVFIGSDIFLGEKDIDSLLEFVASGNTAFISAKNFPEELMNTLFPSHCNDWVGHHTYKDSVVSMNFNHVDLVTDSGYVYKAPSPENTLFPKTYNWQGTNGNYFCDSATFTHIGFIKGNSEQGDYLNFLKVDYGNGSFYFHTTPVVFTNYYLRSKSGLEYTEKAFSHLAPGKIYWDEFSQTSYTEEDSQAGESPIKLILNNPSLRFAWYLLLALVILYLIFFARRKQRPIPLLIPNINSSLEFVRTIGRLYFQQQNHRHLLKLKQKLFYLFIWQRYGISTSNVSEQTIQLIAEKSNVPKENVKTIFEEIKMVNRYDLRMEQDDVFRIHSHLEFFYKNCK